MMCIVQARTGSKRLPGKVLMEIDGRPIIEHVILACHMSKNVDKVVVAIPDGDTELLKYGEEFGPEDDVQQRFENVLVKYPRDCFIRVCADSPMLDHRVIDAVCGAYLLHGPDVARSRCPGSNVEVVNSRAFLALMGDREHVTSGLYRTHNVHTLANTVDTQEDFDCVKRQMENK